MKYNIAKPAAIEVGAAVPFAFDDYIKFLVSTCHEFNRSGDGIRAGYRVEEALDASPTCLALKEELYQLVAQASENPTVGYPVLNVATSDGKTSVVQIARKLLPFLDAIKNAVAEEPKD